MTVNMLAVRLRPFFIKIPLKRNFIKNQFRPWTLGRTFWSKAEKSAFGYSDELILLEIGPARTTFCRLKSIAKKSGRIPFKFKAFWVLKRI